MTILFIHATVMAPAQSFEASAGSESLYRRIGSLCCPFLRQCRQAQSAILGSAKDDNADILFPLSHMSPRSMDAQLSHTPRAVCTTTLHRCQYGVSLTEVCQTGRPAVAQAAQEKE